MARAYVQASPGLLAGDRVGSPSVLFIFGNLGILRMSGPEKPEVTPDIGH
jgi:hypothetical protein